MAVLSGYALTAADIIARQDPSGNLAPVVEMLSQSNEVLNDMLWVEGNLPTGHKTTVRTGLPQGAWRLLNYGVPRGKSTTAQVVDTCGMLEAYSEVDKSIVDLSGSPAVVRLAEDKAYVEGMSQQMAQTLFYGDTSINPERFLGLAARYSTIDAARAKTAANVIDMGGTGSTNTSVWIVVWGVDTVHGIYPKGSKAGLQQNDLGEWTLQDANGGQYQGYRSHYKWDCGLTVRDWRYAARLANIDVSALDGANPPDLIKGLIRGLRKLPTQPARVGAQQSIGATGAVTSGFTGRVAIYCNRDIATALDLQALSKTNVLLRPEEFDGKPVTTFRGVPIRTVDALLNTEARVV